MTLVYSGTDAANKLAATNDFPYSETVKMYGFGGDDELKGAFLQPNLIYGGLGNDSVYGGAKTNWLYGDSGDDVLNCWQGKYSELYGGTGNDHLQGGYEGNLLDGGTGNDTMIGGDGADTYVVDSLSDQVVESYAPHYDNDPNPDDLVRSKVSWTLGSRLENLTLTGTSGISGTGNGLANLLIGNKAANVLNGETGGDTMFGGDGSDTYYVDNLGDVVSETNSVVSTGGTDVVYSYLSAYTLGANVENGHIVAAGTASLTGNSLNNVLYAGMGNNILNGSTGTDTLSYAYGVSGTSGVTASLASTLVQATGGSGSDTLMGIENLIGSAYADKLTGNTGANTLSGGTGNDILTGGRGADKLTGGTGADRFDFNALAELGLSSSTWDTITDFKTSDRDKIDLLGVDANTALTGNQAFTFIGAVSTFTGNATGQLRFDATAHILYGSTDANTAAEFAIVLTGVNSLAVADLVL